MRFTLCDGIYRRKQPWRAGDDKALERLAKDLRASFTTMRGFSRSNLFYMRQVYEAWESADKTVQQLVGQIPWGHHLVLLAKVK